MDMSYINLEEYLIKPEIVLEIPENIARRYELIAIDRKGDTLIVAMSDPLNIFAIDDIKLLTKSKIHTVIASKETISYNIDKFYKKEYNKEILREFIEDYNFEKVDKIGKDELLEVNMAPIVKLINSLIEQAIDIGSSDIHIEPNDEDIRIRFRIDGVLHEITRLSINSLSGIITRIKIMGNMNIAEKRIPQDGSCEMKINDKEIDIRISIVPTIYGEKVVLRLLNRTNPVFSRSELGFNKYNLEKIDRILGQPYGMLLVTGPAGSGKTTTLYSILNEQNKDERNIITIEDPVEYKLRGINQIEINLKAGLTFATGLRSILRQDPDIIMIGEIRDSETAQIATRAAITGHLVFSTLHTSDSISSIVRLVDMGVKPYLVSAAITGVISQRLVRKLCPICKIPYEISYSEKSLLGLNTNDKIIFYKPKGCDKCHKGYKGRRVVQEVLVVNEDIRHLIDKGASIDELRAFAQKQGMVNLLGDAVGLAMKGITSFEEVLGVGYTLG
jgi:type IV pilus assembly protein PilB